MKQTVYGMADITTGELFWFSAPEHGCTHKAVISEISVVTCSEITDIWDDKWIECPVCGCVAETDGHFVHKELQ